MTRETNPDARPIRIGISACLLGQEVRYNGGHKRDETLIMSLGRLVEWVPVCPEVEMGLGTPREPMRLVRVGKSLRMITTESGIDHTDALKDWAQTRLQELAEADLSGYVLKKDSPSCGLEGVKVVDPGAQTVSDGRGLFAEALLRRFPSLPVEEEGRLAVPEVREEFIKRVLAYRENRLRRRRPETEQYRSVPVTRVGRGIAGPTRDLAAVEEPLEVRLHGKPFAVIMRTPGDDRALAAGFLLSEGIVQSADDIGAVEHCRHPDRPDGHNVVTVYLIASAAASLDKRLEERRNILTNSSCGLCGRVTIESLRVRVDPLPVSWSMAKEVAAALPGRLRERQHVFEGTGGLHAAGLFRVDGECDASAEDVGRHNAVDKVIGMMLLEERLPLQTHALAVSGRASYEIVQKAWLAGIGLVCAISAPSSLAIDLAEEAGITLLGFARDGGFNVYSHPTRLSGM